MIVYSVKVTPRNNWIARIWMRLRGQKPQWDWECRATGGGPALTGSAGDRWLADDIAHSMWPRLVTHD